MALLQTAVNPYISILGPIEGAAQRIATMPADDDQVGAGASFCGVAAGNAGQHEGHQGKSDFHGVSPWGLVRDR